MKKSIFDLKENIVALLSYFWVFAIVAIILEKENKFVRFHAMQSILFNICVFVVTNVLKVFAHIPVLGFLFSWLNALVYLAALVVIIFAAYMAYKENDFRIPIIGDVAYRQVNK